MTMRVLIVEDDPSSLELMAETLMACETEVLALSDPEEAALKVKSDRFDGIFLDLMMPGISGLDLTREIRGSPCNRNTPVVIVTGQNAKDTMREAFDAGATFILYKPVDQKRIVRLFESIRGTMLSERRRFFRASIRTDVTCIQGGHKIAGKSVDISEASIRFRDDGSVRTGRKVHLRFQLPEQSRCIEARAIVAYADENHNVSCQFVHLEDEDREAIRSLVGIQTQESKAALMGW